MGSPAGEHKRAPDERQHRVTISRDFLLGVTEITQGQWESVMGSSPSYFNGCDDCPVEDVSWYDVLVYCNALSVREGLEPAYTINGTSVGWNRSALGYRLPTESEWEYACRSGTSSPFSFGNDINPSQVNYDGRYPYRERRKGRYGNRTVDAGSLPANAWGLREMHGNVREWCWDWYAEHPGGAVTDPAGPVAGSGRVLRGGFWSSGAQYCRSAYRNWSAPDRRSQALGFRLARSTS